MFFSSNCGGERIHEPRRRFWRLPSPRLTPSSQPGPGVVAAPATRRVTAAACVTARGQPTAGFLAVPCWSLERDVKVRRAHALRVGVASGNASTGDERELFRRSLLVRAVSHPRPVLPFAACPFALPGQKPRKLASHRPHSSSAAAGDKCPTQGDACHSAGPSAVVSGPARPSLGHRAEWSVHAMPDCPCRRACVSD